MNFYIVRLTRRQQVVLGLLQLIEGLIRVASFGFLDPEFTSRWTLRCLSACMNETEKHAARNVADTYLEHLDSYALEMLRKRGVKTNGSL